jgi:leucyl aminopeptidase
MSNSKAWIVQADPKSLFGHFTFDYQKSYKVLKTGLGAQKVSQQRLRKLIHKIVAFLKPQGAKILQSNLAQASGYSVDFVLQAFLEANYAFDEYKSQKETLCELALLVDASKNKQELKIIAEAIKFTKDLVNTPPNLLTPKALAQVAVSLSKKSANLKVSIKDEQQCIKLGLKAFLEVARASVNRPYLIEVEYTPPKAKVERVGLIGKGLTYDTGGLCLKPNKYMNGMQSDMAGAATVLGIISAAAELNLNVPITALVLACENGFSGDAYRPGDVIGSLSGKTIEIVDTDAEGRVTLADAITYLSKKPQIKTIIDFATLTGSCASALGEVASGGFTNNKTLLANYQKAAAKTGEPVWELPMFEEYKDDLKSDIADLAQCAGRPDASIAALFLQEFLLGKQAWLHLDIAGTAYLDEESEYYKVGATGRGVWSTIEYLKHLT